MNPLSRFFEKHPVAALATVMSVFVIGALL